MDPDPGDSIRYRVGLRRRHADLHEANPTHTYTQRGRFTAVLTRDRLVRQDGRDEHGDHRRQHQPDDRRSTAGRGRHVRLRRQHPVQGHGHRSGGRRRRLRRRPGDVRARSRHARPRRGVQDRLHAASCRRSPTTSRTAATCSASSASRYTDKGGPGGVPTLTTISQMQIRQKQAAGRARRQPVRARTTATNTDERRRRAPRQPRAGRLAPAQRPVQPGQHQLGHVPRGRHRRPAARAGLAAGRGRDPHRTRSPGRSWRRPT